MDAFNDLVITELSKAGPEGLDKKELQEKTGLGTSDLRAAIAAVEAEGQLIERGGRYVGADQLDVEPPAAMPVPGEEPDAEDAEETAVPAADLHGYRAAFEMTVEFKSGTPQQAVADAKLLAEDAKEGLLKESPTVGISLAGLVVTEFAERRVWPAQD